MQFGSLWVASRTVDAYRRVFNGCLICLRGGPSRSALLWFNCPGNTVLHPGVLSMWSHIGLLPQCLFIVRSRAKVNRLKYSLTVTFEQFRPNRNLTLIRMDLRP
jgi:transposase